MSTHCLKAGYYHQLEFAKEHLKNGDFKKSYYHFENAHILGQKHIWRHTLSHYWMLIFGLKTKNSKEIIGQIFRVIASLLFTTIWVPVGNTGGTNISPIKPIPIRKELTKYF